MPSNSGRSSPRTALQVARVCYSGVGGEPVEVVVICTGQCQGVTAVRSVWLNYTLSFLHPDQFKARVFENRVLRRIFGPKREKVPREWGRLHNEELNDLNSTNVIWLIKSSRMRWVGHIAHMWERKVAYRVLVGNPEGKRTLGRPRHRWEDNIKMDLQEVGCGGMDWIDLVQNRNRWWALVNAVMNLQVP